MSQYFVEYIDTDTTPCEDGVRGVVLEAQIHRSPGDGGLAADRVAVDVEGVRLVLDVLQAREEHRVEGRRRHLGDAATEVLLEDAVADDEALGEPVLAGALTDGVVERERLARLEDRAVDDVGGPADVGVA